MFLLFVRFCSLFIFPSCLRLEPLLQPNSTAPVEFSLSLRQHLLIFFFRKHFLPNKNKRAATPPPPPPYTFFLLLRLPRYKVMAMVSERGWTRANWRYRHRPSDRTDSTGPADRPTHKIKKEEEEKGKRRRKQK